MKLGAEHGRRGSRRRVHGLMGLVLAQGLTACGQEPTTPPMRGVIAAPDAATFDASQGIVSNSTDGRGNGRQRVIVDTDANNELDDQHAIAYALSSSDVFDVEGVTVNRTILGGSIDDHVAEAERVVALCAADGVPVLKGADADFATISTFTSQPDFDGREAVDFIIERAHAADSRRLTLVPIGKLTNVALALHKDPSIADKVRVVWLGSNWPDEGEYNLVNDTAAVSYVVDSGVELAIAVVRYSVPSGTDAVRVTTEEIMAVMPGLGPTVVPPIIGRNGGSFSNFGDYSVDLFTASGSSERALYDVSAVAVVKNAGFAQAVVVPAPSFVGGVWSEQPAATHTVTFYEWFDRDGIVADFFDTMRNYVLP